MDWRVATMNAFSVAEMLIISSLNSRATAGGSLGLEVALSYPPPLVPNALLVI